MTDQAVTEEKAEAERGEAGRRGRKSPGAYRTISEVADELQVPQHVLRFWETKFPQIRPLKRGGGRRYYRPEDIALLRRIANLLYVQGYTIKGVQRLLRGGGAEEALEDAALAEPEEAAAEDDEAPEGKRPQLALPGMADDEEDAPVPKPVVRVRAESTLATRSLPPDTVVELYIDGRQVALAARPPAAATSKTRVASPTGKTAREGSRDQAMPQVFIMSSGDVTPFELHLRPGIGQPGITLRVADNGATKQVPDEH